MIMVAASRGVKPHTGQAQSATCESTLAPGSTVAQPHLRSPLPRDKPAVQAPAIGAPGTQRRRRSTQETPRYGIGQENTPVAPKACMNSACERAGMYGARAHRKLASAQLTRSTGLTSRANGLRAARVCAARAASAFIALVPALCAHQAGALPRKFRRSSHRCHRPQAPAPLTRTTRRSQYLQYISPNRTSDYSPLCQRSLRR